MIMGRLHDLGNPAFRSLRHECGVQANRLRQGRHSIDRLVRQMRGQGPCPPVAPDRIVGFGDAAPVAPRPVDAPGLIRHAGDQAVHLRLHGCGDLLERRVDDDSVQRPQGPVVIALLKRLQGQDQLVLDRLDLGRDGRRLGRGLLGQRLGRDRQGRGKKGERNDEETGHEVTLPNGPAQGNATHAAA